MTADVEMLPLPEPKFLARRTASGEWLELLDASDWTAEMWEHGTDPVYSADQLRANVAHATAAKDAEIEALRAELAEMRKYTVYERMKALEARAERLAEALRDLEVCANTVDHCYTRNPGNFAVALRELRESAERSRAALNPTAAQGHEAASA